MKIEITNVGVIEEEALTLLGASTKREDDKKIGYFGSGNKYAIATLLKHNVEFEIWAGENRIEIGTVKKNFRDQKFDIITVNGKETSMTVQAGPQWELWFAVREFVCNAIDEGGHEVEIVEESNPEAGKTKIYLYGDELMEVVQNWDKYFCENVKTLYYDQTNKIAFREKDPKEKACRYYRKGILIQETEKYSLFHYDFANIHINESRTPMNLWEAPQEIARALAGCTDIAIVKKFLRSCNTESVLEYNLNWQYTIERKASWSETWGIALADRLIIPRSAVQWCASEDIRDAVIVQDNLYSKLKMFFPELSFYDEDTPIRKYVDPSRELNQAFYEALQNLSEIGIYTDIEFKFVEFKRDTTLACYNHLTEEIAISTNHPIDVIELEATIKEEIDHSIGLDDMSRSYQVAMIKEIIALRKQIKAATL